MERCGFAASLPAHQLIRYAMRLVRLRPLPPPEILDVPLVVPLGVVEPDRCWGLTSTIVIGETDADAAAESVLHDVLCQRAFDTSVRGQGSRSGGPSPARRIATPPARSSPSSPAATEPGPAWAARPADPPDRRGRGQHRGAP